MAEPNFYWHVCGHEAKQGEIECSKCRRGKGVEFFRPPEEPDTNSLTSETHQRMIHDPRYVDGHWTESQWLWEEVRQLNVVISMQKAEILKLNGAYGL